jgi:hypothetical protein
VLRTLLLLTLLSACGAVEHARLNPLYPVESAANVSPPIIDPVVRDCARAVHVRGVIPGALVQVWSNDFEEIGRAVPSFGEADIPLKRPLDVEDILTASQTVAGIESAQSRVTVLVEAWRGTPRAPTIDGPVWQCGRVVHLSGLEDSCRVELLEDDSLRAMDWSPGRSKGVVANTELRRGSSITAVQYACELDIDEKGPRTRRVSDEATAVKVTEFPRDGLPAPSVDASTVRPGVDAVVIKELYVGAMIDVFVDGVPAGEGLATDVHTAVALFKPVEEGSVVTAEQSLCEPSPASEPVAVEGDLPLLEIVGPVCDDDPWITVRHGVLNTTIAVLQGDRIVGTGGSQQGLSRIGLSGLIPGLPITAVQYYGDVAVSDPSDEVRVCCCTEGCNADLMALREDDPETWDTHTPASCSRSRNPLFAVKEHPVFELEIAADWAAMNGPTSASTGGTLQQGKLELDATLTPRDDERFDDCEYRPFEIEFGRLQSGNAFEGHRRLEVLTHCGAGEPEFDRRRLMMEYTLHKALLAIDHAGLDVRLAEIVYRDPDGSERHRELAILRERGTDACERCGWQRQVAGPVVAALDESTDEPDPDPESEEAPPIPVDDPATRYASDLLDRFVSGTGSGQEAISCADAAGSTFSIPWDWDLEDVARNPGRHRVFAFDKFLGASLPPVGTRIQAWYITRQDAAMRTIIQESPLDPIGRERLLAWYDLYMKTLKCYLGFK